MRQEYPKMIYNKTGMATTVNSLEEHGPLKAYFDCNYNSELPHLVVSYTEACECLKEAKEEVKEEVKEEIKKEVVVKKEVVKEKEVKKVFLPLEKNLSSYTWNELRKIGREVEDKYGVELPLRAKRDVVEKAIKGVLENDDSK